VENSRGSDDNRSEATISHKEAYPVRLAGRARLASCGTDLGMDSLVVTGATTSGCAHGLGPFAYTRSWWHAVYGPQAMSPAPSISSTCRKPTSCRSPRSARHGPLATGRSPRAARHGPLATGWSGSANSPPERVQWPPSKVILCLGAMDNFFGFRQIVDK
jgi:hypothetical protein